jgi:hypothetical protein
MFNFQNLFGQKKGKPQEPIRPFSYIEKEVSFVNQVDGTVLNGTLTLPDDKKNYPAVILVTGSGPHNRDEQMGAHKPFLVLADHLTQLGIAVLRYDDRHLTMSVRQGWKYTTMDLASDAKAAVGYLSSLSNIDASFIGIAGHSEGGVIASIVASSEARVSYIISLAGPGISGYEISMDQAVDLAEDHRDLSYRKKVIEILKQEPDINLRKQKIKRIGNNIYGRFNIKAKLKIGLYLDMTVSEWNKFFTDYNPAEAWQKVTCPVLAINGAYDQQVQAGKNLAAIEQALKMAGNKDFKTIIIPKANHLFQIIESGKAKSGGSMVKAYLESEQTIAPEVMKIIGDWILLQYQIKSRMVSNLTNMS